jgi:hypothetical protein
MQSFIVRVLDNKVLRIIFGLMNEGRRRTVGKTA